MVKKCMYLLVIISILCGYYSFAWSADRGPINSEETKIGLDITAPSYMDSWTFEGQEGDRVIINAVKTTGNLDTYIDLYSPPPGSGKEASSYPWYYQLDHQCQKTGLYTIVIQDYGLNDPGT
jgi:hypothetical protein